MSMESALNVLAKMPTPEQKAALQSQPGVDVKPPGNSAQTETTAASPPTETSPTAPEKTLEKPAKDLSAEFSALAKREKQIVQLQKSIKEKEASIAAKAAEKEAAISAKEAAIAAREAKIKEAEELWSTDLFKSLEARGLDYNTITKMYLEGQKVPPKTAVDPEAAVSKALADFEKKQAAKDAEKQAAEQKAQEAAAQAQQELEAKAWANYKSEIKTFLDTNSTDYELTNLYDQTDLVADVSAEYYEKNQKVLSIEEACKMVEKYLEEEAQKAFKAKKFAKSETKETPKIEEKPATPATKTLTNQLTPSFAPSTSAKTESDRMKRALAKLGG